MQIRRYLMCIAEYRQQSCRLVLESCVWCWVLLVVCVDVWMCTVLRPGGGFISSAYTTHRALPARVGTFPRQAPPVCLYKPSCQLSAVSSCRALQHRTARQGSPPATPHADKQIKYCSNTPIQRLLLHISKVEI